MGFFDSAKQAIGLTPVPSEDTPIQPEPEDSLCPKLTFQQRIVGFAACFTVGYLITFASFRHFVELIEGDPVPFAVTYSVGNIMALLSSMFLCGPERQLKLMMDQKRKLTAILYVSCIGLTLVLLFLPLPQTILLFLIFMTVLVQIGAAVWYNLSYIPFGRRTFLKCVKGAMGVEDDAASSTNSGIV
mmetsp:Transcript_3992/g.6685  ORF Transcript_3992/g.6685 Transcript_3992/m.6685 type:complete len:187 (-) Transcript_3992:91-651(-)|eukprot:CAMPEP_0119003820 /NCGR_PEP_ID=MMETSP1176-20130426/787_1 /TAXON_ID=265551 /ORGANISM="Synedropsis recta cf, Strain CCMP1620" /LENGTH=186 /DNA_ID=CAMNT_0006955457 /DNA_START=24 /DNA_END=584 /DNA_ORIENTATION=-